MTTPFHTIPIPEAGDLTFYTKDDLLKWVQDESQIWSWLWSGDTNGATIGPGEFNHISNTFRTGIQLAVREDEQGLREFSNWVRENLDGNSVRFLISQSPNGHAVLNAMERIGVGAARVMYRTIWQGVDWQHHIQNPTDIKGVILAADPSSVEQASIAGELQRERANYRGAISRLESRVRELEQENRDRDARRIGQMRGIVALLRKGVRRKSDAITLDFARESQAAMAQIRETEDLFRRQMELRAPVEYWESKATEHSISEDRYFKATLAYFVLASIVIALAGFGGAEFIKNIPKSEDRTPLYLITSGALLAITTMVFWAGRLIVKLWLSEHHLHIDARERAVMTKTYLAMTENGAAQDADRAIVLSAIFRPAPDGVVREEGPQDLGLQALLAKILAKP